jgi:hypothetical protein
MRSGEIIGNCGGNLPEMERKTLAANLRGLTSLQCEDLLALSLATRNALDSQFIRTERARLLSQQAGKVIQLCEPSGDLDEVGGLGCLKRLAHQDGPPVSCSRGCGKGASLPQPRGVLLTGPPGCGKSYLVQALAGSWGVNLVRLEPARLFRSFVGETEQNFLSAFETVKALAPAVLWIDELEKLFAHGAAHSGDGGVLSRVLSLFLDFLQSSREGTFVCATTNAIAGLPQEILRPGRFDAVFFIDLPNRKEREHILTILFRKYGLAGELEGRRTSSVRRRISAGPRWNRLSLRCFTKQRERVETKRIRAAQEHQEGRAPGKNHEGEFRPDEAMVQGKGPRCITGR